MKEQDSQKDNSIITVDEVPLGKQAQNSLIKDGPEVIPEDLPASHHSDVAREESHPPEGDSSALSQPLKDEAAFQEHDQPVFKEVRLCRVRLRPEAVPVTFLAGDLKITPGEWVVVETDHGIEVGQVIDRAFRAELPEKNLPRTVKRFATTSEIEEYYHNVEKEQEAWALCQRLNEKLGLRMKLVRVERYFDGSKIVFYYSSDGRVDFRELVKELVKELKIRIKMRQIGIRHEAKMIGGVGSCGRELCCAGFLKGFDPISIKMAKAQNLPLNPNKISGFCGRLLCCLTFEYDTYRELSRDMPGLGKSCVTPKGQGRVVRQNIFKREVTVLMPDGSFEDYMLGDLSGRDDTGEGSPSNPDQDRGEQKIVHKAQSSDSEKQYEKTRDGTTGEAGRKNRGSTHSAQKKRARHRAKRGDGKKK